MSLHWEGRRPRGFLAILLAASVSLGAFAATTAGKSAAPTARSLWPFDQRQIVLVHSEGQSVPDTKTLAQLLDLFARLGRVRWVTQAAGPGQIIPFSVPNDFQWQSRSVVRELGLRYKADGIVWVAQKGVQLDLRWYATSDGQPLFFESVSLPEAGPRPGEEEARKKRLADWVGEIWAKIPGVGYVVKRDLSTVSIEGAAQNGLKVGDVIELRRLQETIRHPLLQTIVSIPSSITGRAVVKSVPGDPFALAEIEYESSIDPIQEGDRYRIVTTPATPTASGSAPVSPVKDPAPVMDDQGRSYLPLFGENEKASSDSPPVGTSVKDDGPAPLKIFDLSALLTMGSVQHQESTSSQTYTLRQGMAPGFRVLGKAYLTREILFLGDLGFSLLNFDGAPYGAGSVGSGLSTLRFGGAYRFIFLNEGNYPGELGLSLSYRRLSLGMTTLSSTNAPSAKAYGGIELGLAVQMPLADRFAASLRGARLITAALSETPVSSGAEPSSEVWEFEGSLKYQLTRASELGFGLLVESASTTFNGAGDRAVPALSSLISTTQFEVGYVMKF